MAFWVTGMWETVRLDRVGPDEWIKDKQWDVVILVVAYFILGMIGPAVEVISFAAWYGTGVMIRLWFYIKYIEMGKADVKKSDDVSES